MEGSVMRVYQIKGNVMTSLVVNPNCPKTAIFNGKANIKDITNPLLPISVDGNASLQVKMTDMGEPGSSDSIAITVWDKNGGLWFASNWNGTTTIKQVLAGGNLKVHGGTPCSIDPPVNFVTKNLDLKSAPELLPFTVKAYPNPSENHFNLVIEGASREKIRVMIYNVLGAVVANFERNADELIRFGEGLRAGVYMIEVLQGKNKKSVTLIKQE